jgi:putative salt-induced outer membrane protein YdiY
MSHMKTHIAVVCLILLSPWSLPGRLSTDVVVMNNGDRLTCQIKKLERGVLYASLDYVDGVISIDWSRVARLESTQLFAVETQSGMTYTGTLMSSVELADQPRRIEIADEQSAKQALVEQAKVASVQQYSDSIWQRMSGSLSMGLTYSKGSDTTQYNLDTTLAYRQERYFSQLNYNSALTYTAGTKSTTRNQLDINVQRLMRWSNWYYSGIGDFLQSSAQSIAFQSVLGAGVGRFLKNTATTRLRVTGGLALQRVQYTHSATENQLVGTIGAELYIFRFKKTDLTVTPLLLPSLTDRGRLRLNLNSQYKVQIISDLWWNISFYGNWDNRPPEGLVGNDYGTTIGITYTFH